MTNARNKLVLLVSVMLVAGGCVGKKSNVRAPWYGETDSLNRVVQDVNANNGRVKQFWAFGYFEADIVEKLADMTENKTFVNGDLRVLYRAPGELRIVGNKEIVGSVFDVGSNETMYWLTAGAGVDTIWYGRYADLDRADTAAIPIRPDLLLDVLGVNQIDTHLLAQSAPMMRFNNDAHAYMIVWSVRLQDRWAARKEVWYDRETKLPTLVLLFDENGRIVLRAYLAAHQAIGKDGPKIATSYRLFFPDTGTKLTMRLDDLAFDSDDAPNDASFMFPSDEARAKLRKQVDIDAANQIPSQPPSPQQDGSPQ